MLLFGWVYWVLLIFLLNFKKGLFYLVSYFGCFKVDKCYLWLSGFWLCRFFEVGKRVCGFIIFVVVYEFINGGVNGFCLFFFLKKIK